MTPLTDRRLADGRSPLTPVALFARFAELGIEHRTCEHPPVYTVEQAKQFRNWCTGAHTKNLFLRDKKGVMWLVTCEEDRLVDLGVLSSQLGAKGKLSFASPERLQTYLGVTPGSVTPLAVVNDVTGRVILVVERQLLGEEWINVHPLVNSMTTSLRTADLVRFAESTGHAPIVVG